MLNLNDLYYFVQVVDHKGFAAASRALDLPKSSLSRRIGELEAHLGARLLERTSRQFSVTDAGSEFYEHALRALIEAEAAEVAVRRRLTEPAGRVRFSCSVSIAQFALAPLLPRFARRFPKIQLVQHATDRYVDVVEENFDLAIRAHAGTLPDSSLVQRRLLFSPRWLVAAPDHLRRLRGCTSPDDLMHCHGIAFGNQTAEAVWRLNGAAGDALVRFKPAMYTDDVATMLEAARSGLGVASIPAFVCHRDVSDGVLARVLPDWTSGGAQVTALIPSRRNLLPSVRAFLDFLVEELPRTMLGGGTRA